MSELAVTLTGTMFNESEKAKDIKNTKCLKSTKSRYINVRNQAAKILPRFNSVNTARLKSILILIFTPWKMLALF
ncbi:MAG: hypothetical protein JWQ40_1095 [Segetibacter sp.]|nr:hypothetical protein [Segetibacter sp.]